MIWIQDWSLDLRFEFESNSLLWIIHHNDYLAPWVHNLQVWIAWSYKSKVHHDSRFKEFNVSIHFVFEYHKLIQFQISSLAFTTQVLQMFIIYKPYIQFTETMISMSKYHTKKIYYTNFCFQLKILNTLISSFHVHVKPLSPNSLSFSTKYRLIWFG